MSATAATESSDSSPNRSANLCDKRCGEVFVIRRQIILCCSLCGKQYGIYKKFLEHIIAHFSDVQRADTHRHASSESSDGGDCVVAKDTVEEVFIVSQQTAAEIAQSTAANAAVDMNAISDEDCAETDSGGSTRAPSSLLLARKKKYKSTERKYKCATCGAAFTDLSNMRAHSKRHTSDKPYACKECEKRFHSNTELESHMRRHTGERPYVCSYCGKGFATSSEMRNHERRHTNYRPHKCEICKKCFYEAKRLKDHLVVHTKERNHVCNTCNSRFSRRKALLVHMKLHANAREYACDLCDMAFNQSPALLLHRKNKHQVLIPNPKIGRPRKSASIENVELTDNVDKNE